MRAKTYWTIPEKIIICSMFLITIVALYFTVCIDYQMYPKIFNIGVGVFCSFIASSIIYLITRTIDIKREKENDREALLAALTTMISYSNDVHFEIGQLEYIRAQQKCNCENNKKVFNETEHEIDTSRIQRILNNPPRLAQKQRNLENESVTDTISKVYERVGIIRCSIDGATYNKLVELSGDIYRSMIELAKRIQEVTDMKLK